MPSTSTKKRRGLSSPPDGMASCAWSISRKGSSGKVLLCAFRAFSEQWALGLLKLCCHLLHLPHRTQMISPRYFANVLIRILPSQQFGEQVRIAGYIIQAFRHRVMANIIEIRANADMIDAFNITTMLYVVGNLRAHRTWVEVLGVPDR